MSTEYIAVAEELSALVAAAQAQSWQGAAASSYAAANAPYVAWLTRAAADAAATAAQHETAAVSYATALAAMPTLGELAANHATHTVLLATNFFGINTIPIALNEADYVRMWVQAATTMTVYQSVSTASVTAAPPTEAAPPIVRAGPAAASADPLSSLTEFLTEVEQIFNRVGGGGNQSLLDYLFSVPPGTDPLSLILNDISVASSPTTGYPALLQALVAAAGNNPALIAAAYAFGGVAIVYDVTIQVIQFLVTFPLLAAGLAPLLAGPALAGLAAAGSVGIAEVAAHVHAGAEPVPIGPTAPVVSPAPMPAPAGTAPAPAAVAPALAPAAPLPTTAPAVPVAPGAPPPPGGTPAGPFSYLMGGSVGMNSPAVTKAGVKRKSPATETAETPAALAALAQEKARARRQRRAKVEVRGRGYEYMDLDDNVKGDAGHGPDAASSTPTRASDRGAERLGFTGTARRPAAVASEAAGLTMLGGDEFGSGPTTPLMPSTWAPDESDAAGSR